MITYRLRFAAPAQHHVDVEIEIPAPAADQRLWMPVWTPGSYMIREFARNVRDPRATGPGGRELPLRWVDKATLAVAAGHAGSVRVSYRVYCFELSVRTSFVDDENALLNGASVFFAVAGREGEPIRVEIDLPPRWDVATALPAEPSRAAAFRAQDFDHLVDSPIQCGRFERRSFELLGRTHEFAFCRVDGLDPDRAASAAARLFRANAELFGGLPYERYLTIVQGAATGRGGLEHRDSTVLQVQRHSFGDEKGWLDFLTILAHEHVHVWNVKRARPRSFVPYDLTRENYTDLLWVAEGITAYYDELQTLRAGCMAKARYLERLADEIGAYRESPGRLAASLAESSLLAWTRFYRQDEDWPNSGVSYYQKGALVALLLDLEIRSRSAGRGDLDVVMRRLLERYGAESAGYAAAEFEALAAEVAGADLRPFFDRTVRGTEELDLEGGLLEAGFCLQPRARPAGPAIRDLAGFRVKSGSERIVVEAVERGSPAETAGISARDEIVALDGSRVIAPRLQARLKDSAGKRVRVALFRDDRLLDCELELRAEAPAAFVIVEDPAASPARRALGERWLAGAPSVREGA